MNMQPGMQDLQGNVLGLCKFKLKITYCVFHLYLKLL